jgi:hypothetical protein
MVMTNSLLYGQAHGLRQALPADSLLRLSDGQKSTPSSRSQTSTAVSRAIPVNTPTLERRYQVQTITVAIACTTGVDALLLRRLGSS